MRLILAIAALSLPLGCVEPPYTGPEQDRRCVPRYLWDRTATGEDGVARACADVTARPALRACRALGEGRNRSGKRKSIA